LTSNELAADRGLVGEVAIVTGGGRGIGRAIAQRLAQAGATTILVARSTAELQSAVSHIKNTGGQATYVRADVTDHTDVERMVGNVLAEFGSINLLVNSAGDPGPIAPVWEMDIDRWWYCMEVNLRGPFLCAKAVLPQMIKQGCGRIVNIASASGLEPLAYDSAYVTSKSALLRLTENIAMETKTYGISIFSVDPGTVRTAMTEKVLQSVEMRTWMPWLQDIFDQGNDVPPERVAQLVRDLASGKADVLSGCLISIWDNIDEMVAQRNDIDGRNLYRLRLLRL